MWHELNHVTKQNTNLKTQIKKHEKKTNEKAVVPPNLPTFKQYLVPCSGFVVFERGQKFFNYLMIQKLII